MVILLLYYHIRNVTGDTASFDKAFYIVIMRP